MHSGLAVVLSVVCSKCNSHFRICSSKQIQATDGSNKWLINVAAVLSQMGTGGGLARLNDILATIDIPGMNKKIYTATERYLGSEIKKQLLVQLAATQEKDHAISIGRYHQGIPRQSK